MVRAMRKAVSCVLLALIGSACGTEPDTRPETADYIITAILEPTCGRAACHSAASQAKNLAFDTIPSSLCAMTKTIERHGTMTKMVVPGHPEASRLYLVLIDSGSPMPPDQVMPTVNIDLIQRWIDDGASGFSSTASCP
jgi:hypothetical protein